MGKVPLTPTDAVFEFAAPSGQSLGFAFGCRGKGVALLVDTFRSRLVKAALVHEDGAVGDVDGYAGLRSLVVGLVVAFGEIEAVGIAARGWVEAGRVGDWVHVVAVLIDDPMTAGNSNGNLGAFRHLVDCTCQELGIDLCDLLAWCGR